MYPYHNRLKQLLRQETYIIEPAQSPFAYRFIFIRLGKSIPIRPHRVAEYVEWLGGIR